MKKLLVSLALGCFFSHISFAQTSVNFKELKKIYNHYTALKKSHYQKLIAKAQQKKWPIEIADSNQNMIILSGIDHKGYPTYKSVFNNVTAAATIGTSNVWPSGLSGYGLSGSSSFLKNKLGIWDGGAILGSHQELLGRIDQMDNPGSISNHATHVSGTMIASGVNANAKGMSYGANNLLAWDFNDDIAEIANAAPNLLVSNHSYGILSGWTTYTDPTTNATGWLFRGEAGATEDFKFGYYSEDAQALDKIAYYAPYYLGVKAAGNSRNQNGPAVGQPYYRYDSNYNIVEAGNRPAGIYSNNRYDIIPWDGNAKNILTVGAVSTIANGYTSSSGVRMSTFSSWGPTDDGRIKPDIVGAGVSITSCYSSGNANYGSLSGTSMASPNISGSLLLLQELYYKTYGNFMRAATLKGLVIHTADEAGTANGPDYRFGWGLMNTGKAADIIASKNIGKHLIQENSLKNGNTYTLNVTAANNGKLSATISWTDVEGKVDTINYLNNRTPRLVNDLDIRITRNGTTYFPWVLDVNSPDSAAKKADNKVDNVEKIEIDSVKAGEVYTITISHKNSLTRGPQSYSLIVSGVLTTGTYCTSSATQTGGTRIDSVSFAGMNNKSITGCSVYKNNIAATAKAIPGATYPLAVYFNSCDATTANKIVKVFIDYNRNNAFDNGEQVAVSNILATTSTSFATNITIPTSVNIGAVTLMRVIVQETTSASSVLACGTYTKGETQDFTIEFVKPAKDITPKSIVWPVNNGCADSLQRITIQVENKGTQTVASTPFTTTVKNTANNALVASFVDTINSPIAPGSTFDYTLKGSFISKYGTSYQIQTIVKQDDLVLNDTVTQTITFANAPNQPAAVANICDNSTFLTITNPQTNTSYYWYKDASSTPFAIGNSIQVDTPSTNHTYAVTAGFSGYVGLSTKTVYPTTGSYVPASGSMDYFNYTAREPLILESAKLYSRNAGKISVAAADVNGNSINYLSNTSTTIAASSKLGGSGTQVDDPADSGAYHILNLQLPQGDHQLLTMPDGTANLYRNNNINTGTIYPFTAGNAFSLTGNNQTNNNQFYPFLYDMKIRTAGCVSAKTTIIATTPAKPIITASGNQLQSNSVTGNQWYSVLKSTSTPINNATQATYTPDSAGTYVVVVTDSTGCIRTSNPFAYTPLPMFLKSFWVSATPQQLLINWITINERNIATYTIEALLDDNSFQVAAVQLPNNSLSQQEYNVPITRLIPNTIGYRIKCTDIDGKLSYSPVVRISNQSTNKIEAVKIIRNPVTSPLLTLQLTNSLAAGKYEISIVDVSGKTVLQKIHQKSNNAAEIINIELPHSLASGIYQVLMNDKLGNKITVSFAYKQQ